LEAGNECNAVLTPDTLPPPPAKWSLPAEEFFAQVLPKVHPPATHIVLNDGLWQGST